jgi:predicted DNA-binding transcriptional regulator YafY
VSRIIQVDLEPEVFTRPDHFRLAEYWKQSKLDFSESLPTLKVKVMAKPAIIGRMTFTNKFVEMVDMATQLNDQMVSVTLDFNTEQEAIEYVLGFGGAMKLVQPEYLIEKVIHQARSVIEMHE